MINRISGFQGEFRFLSNFWEAPLTLDGWTFPSSEHAYQASKSLDPKDWQDILGCVSPGAAKKLGKSFVLRPDWEEIKVDFMTEIVSAKFQQNPQLMHLLQATGGVEIIEENTWGDRFWGVCNGTGENHLGKILMMVRDRYKSIFVFGSNTAGRHGKGAAITAKFLHGAIQGQGDGLMGRSYALPTCDNRFRALPIHMIETNINIFLSHATSHPEWDYQVTRVGCGLAYLTDQQIAPLFRDAPFNCLFDEQWRPFLSSKTRFWGTF